MHIQQHFWTQKPDFLGSECRSPQQVVRDVSKFQALTNPVYLR